MARARTDAEGRFRFAGVAAGRHILRAGAPGYTLPGDTTFGLSGRTITVAEGEKVEGIALALVRGSVITGRVTTAAGRPAIEERITLAWLDRAGTPTPGAFIGGSFEMYMTDDRGVYRIYGVPEGRYLVSAGIDTSSGSFTINRAQQIHPRTYHSEPGTTAREASQAKIVEVREGAEVDGVDIRLAEPIKTYAVSGRVVNADTGAAVAGFDLWRSALHPNGRRGARLPTGQRSGANGEFQLAGLLPGQYEIHGRISTDVEYYGDPTTIVIADADLQGIELRVRRGATISGAAVIEGSDDPAARAGLRQLEVRYERASSQQQTRERVLGSRFNADGSFRLRGVPAGRISLELTTMGPLKIGRASCRERV